MLWALPGAGVPPQAGSILQQHGRVSDGIECCHIGCPWGCARQGAAVWVVCSLHVTL